MARKPKSSSRSGASDDLVLFDKPKGAMLKEFGQSGVYFAVSKGVLKNRNPERIVRSAITKIIGVPTRPPLLTAGQQAKLRRLKAEMKRLEQGLPQSGISKRRTFFGGMPRPRAAGENTFPWASQAEEASISDRNGLLSSDEISKLLGVSRQTINRWRDAGKLLGFAIAKRGYRYPREQIGARGKPLEGLDRIIEQFGGDHWAAWRFLVSELPELDGKTGLDTISSGDIDALLNVIAARSHGSFT